ncbi:pickpocket 30 [Cochliomyia hominivorax]
MTFEQTSNSKTSVSSSSSTPDITASQKEGDNMLEAITCKHCKDKGVNNYLADNNSEKGKYLRVLVIILATICTIYVCLLSSRRYFNSWVQTVIESTDVHVSEISFPAVTICPVKGINVLRLQNINTARTFDATFPPLNEQEMQELHLLLQTFNDVLWPPLVYNNNDDTHRYQQRHNNKSKSLKTETLLEHMAANEKTNRLALFDLKKLFFFLTFDCEDIFAECTWRRTKDPIPTWPWVVSDSGLQTGLQVLLKRSSIGNYFEKVATMIHDPNEIGTSDIIYLNGESVVITVNPLRFTSDNDIRSVKPEFRHCYFTNELKLLGKSRSNCMRNCRLLYIERNCNCTYNLPVGVRSSLPRCRVSDLKCIYKHRSALLTTGNVLEENIDEVEFNTLECKCYPNCNYIQYRTMVNTDNTGTSHSKNYIDLQVQYQHDTLFSYRSTLCFNLLDLIVSYGGIAGLFLGLSLVGIIELLHDFIVCWKIRRQRKHLQTHVQQYENMKNNNDQKKDVNSTNQM